MKVFAALSLMAVAASAAEVVQLASGPPAYVASSLTAHGPVSWAYQQPYYYYYYHNYRQAPATAARFVAVQPAGVVAPVTAFAPTVQVRQRPDRPYRVQGRTAGAGADDAKDADETRRENNASGRYASETDGADRRMTAENGAPPKPSRTAGGSSAVPENNPKTGY